MNLSDDFSQLNQGLRGADASGRQARLYLSRYLTGLVLQLTYSLEEDVMLPPDTIAADTRQSRERKQLVMRKALAMLPKLR